MVDWTEVDESELDGGVAPPQRRPRQTEQEGKPSQPDRSRQRAKRGSIVFLVLLVAAALFLIVPRFLSAPAESPAPPIPATNPPESPEASTSSEPSAEANPLTVDPAATEAAQGFLDAWTETDPDARAEGLDRWATEPLAQAMEQTAEANIWPAEDIDGELTPIAAGQTRAEFRQRFTDGRAVIIAVQFDPLYEEWRALTIAEAVS